MADGFEISITIDGDLTNLMNRIMQKATEAVQEGAARLVEEHEDIIRDWSAESKPEFVVMPPETDGTSYVMVGVKAVGERWHWINEGTGPVDIVGKKMRFPFESGGYFYNSSFTPKISQNWTIGDGQRHGDDFVTSAVHDRSIRPRHMDKKAIERARDDVMAVMRSHFS